MLLSKHAVIMPDEVLSEITSTANKACSPVPNSIFSEASSGAQTRLRGSLNRPFRVFLASQGSTFTPLLVLSYSHRWLSSDQWHKSVQQPNENMHSCQVQDIPNPLFNRRRISKRFTSFTEFCSGHVTSNLASSFLHRSPWWSQVCVSACWFSLGHTNHWTSNEKHKLYKTVFVFTNQRKVISSIMEKITFLFMYREFLHFSSHRKSIMVLSRDHN